MAGRRFTWVIVAGVGALLLAAGVDTFRDALPSADGGAAEPTSAASTTTTEMATDTVPGVPPCARHDLQVAIEVRAKVATVVIRNIADHACRRVLQGWRLSIEDRAGKVIHEWAEEQVPVQPLVVGIFEAGAEVGFWLPQDPARCSSPGPYLASVAVGPYLARRGHLSADQVVCVRSRNAQVRREIERIGNRWAVVFGAGSRSCSHMTQPICERIMCVRVGVGKIRNCRTPTRAFRASFQGATIEDVMIKDDRAAAKFTNGEVVGLCFCGPGTWLVAKLGDNAGRGFFE